MKNFIITVCFIIDCIIAWSIFGHGSQALAFWPFVALAVSSGFGLWNVAQQYQAGQQQAALADQQAEFNAKAARLEAEDDARAENDQMRQTRDQQRRRRSTIEAMYAKSGVLLEGSAANILASQRETDEANIQTGHYAGNERRKRFLWQSQNSYAQGKFQAKSMLRANRFNAIAGVVDTGTQAATNFKTWNS